MPHTVHETYQHTTQKIEANEGHGLGKYSELETMHKLTKHFQNILQERDHMKLFTEIC